MVGSGRLVARRRWWGKVVPRNLLHNIPHESGALAEVALGARDTGLHLARGDLLYTHKPGQPVFLSSNPLIHVSLSPNIFPPSSFSDRMRWWISGWTYVALVKADGNAGLLLDFLGHRGGGRWSMSSMEVRTSNSNLRKYLARWSASAGAILDGLGGCLRLATSELWQQRRPPGSLLTPRFGLHLLPSFAGDEMTLLITR